MSRFKKAKEEEQHDLLGELPPLLDGTVSLEDGYEERAPRLKELLELIHQYHSESSNSKS